MYGANLLGVSLCCWICLVKVLADFDVSLNPVRVDISVWHQRNARVAIRTNDQLTCEKPNIYICEEPLDTVPAGSGKNCSFRNVDYHEQVYRWVAGRGCLLYTPDFLFVDGTNPINLNAGCAYGNLFAPCLEIAKEDGTCGCFPFDPAFEEVAAEVQQALLPSAHGRWEKCYYEANDCCSHFMNDNTSETESNHCKTTFDGWTCWHDAESGTVASAVCSEFAYSNSGPTCHHFSSKECHMNGTWELMTDYSTCSVSPRLLRRYRFYIAMLGVSIVSCLPAVFIFLFYKRLRVTRVALHRNLLIAIIVRNALVIVSRSEIYIDELSTAGDTTMSTHGVWCRVLAASERAAANAVFACMLVDGIYLHRLIVTVFRQKLKVLWLYILIAVIVIIPVAAWVAVMVTHNDHSCWMVYTVSHVQWILDGPRILILLVNTGLFIDILRVLLTKIRNSENAVQLSTVKATLFLMPLFGIQFIFTAFRPSTHNCSLEQAYYYVAYALEGLQGLIVATLYCYMNKEVRSLIKLTYKKTENAVVSRVRASPYPRVNSDPNLDRRLTYSTGLTGNNIREQKDHYVKPKLHVAEIISIQASERLAEILEPVYETIDPSHEGYDCLDRSDIDNDSGFIPNRNSKVDDYYGFTNASSVSIGCQDWLKCVSSPVSSIYNNSVTEYDKPRDVGTSIIHKEPLYEVPSKLCDCKNASRRPIEDNFENGEASFKRPHDVDNLDISAGSEMLDEIMQCMKTNDDIKLEADLLSPNRSDCDKITFLNE